MPGMIYVDEPARFTVNGDLTKVTFFSDGVEQSFALPFHLLVLMMKASHRALDQVCDNTRTKNVIDLKAERKKRRARA